MEAAICCFYCLILCSFLSFRNGDRHGYLLAVPGLFSECLASSNYAPFSQKVENCELSLEEYKDSLAVHLVVVA